MPAPLASRTAIAALGLACATAVTLTACGNSDSSADGKPTVVASTNVWGSVATAVAGDSASVESIIKDPSADPHSYESSPSDAAALSDADLVVYNGGGYDQFVPKVLDSTKDKRTVDAFDIAGNRTDKNEHVFYDVTTVDAVAHKIADQLSELDPGNAKGYADRAAAFESKLRAISDITATIAKNHPKAPVAQTEPIAHYMLTAADVDDLTPPEFEDAIEEGTDPSPNAVATTRDLLSTKKVRALVYNSQTEDKVTQDIKSTAESAGVRIVQVTETLPDGLDYIAWQTQNAQALAAALE
ncbi:metal ABC transporter solute-binding protein, Zn/Mn family [Antrihabitans cavernicola]|uniref:ABC transporter permease n=1 Tax=Antrihabitans cavernicola TaxID=2495913 RepID=A0A5A7SCT3_9NOCA|nr:zinc ABC transporter substrate-binding protein [Spelaeibacter cavernicola]KAA0022011.1 ABC transporter permease [Spelaeibacter cavernicola]